MKKSLILKALASALAVVSLTAAVNAKGFTKTNEYQDGKFTDVPANQWYAPEVKSAYELGFMNGKSDTAFDPNGNVTVAEGITMASRVHSIYNGKTIAEVKGGKWYDMYVAYAKENGLVADGQFTNFDRNIMRYEMAVMFAKAMPADYFTAKNDIKEIPDVAETEEYYDDLMMLYKAGVVLGSDDYGNFYAKNPIKRSETAAIINRVALPENRKEGKLLEYSRNQAVFLIDNFTMDRAPNGKMRVGSGWTSENLFSYSVQADDSSSNVLTDSSTEGVVAIHRAVTTQTTGIVKVETKFILTGSGLSFLYKDINEATLFELRFDSDGKVYAVGDDKVDTGMQVMTGVYLIYYELDLDTRKAKVVVDGKDLGTFDMSKKATDLSKMTITTHEETTPTVNISEVHMYVNYYVMDMFRMNKPGQTPYGWTVSNGVVIDQMMNDLDYNCVKIPGKGTAKKNFVKVSGKFVYETFVKVDDAQSASVSVLLGDKTAVKVDIADGKITSGGKHMRDYTKGVWQLIRVEGDTTTGKALLKVNNKKTIEVDLPVDGIDTILIESTGEGDFYFDDVEVYNVFDYADYVPTPVPVTDDEWYVGMSICSLWREGTHFGWDSVAPYEDVTPLIGFYDEGLPEVADWEIKFMVEHGIDFQHFCWYIGNNGPNIKKTRLSDALNEGYMNAKYSDMQDFMIMWENASNPQKSADEFKRVVWDYWYDWYLTDPRYFCIDNKPVISIYNEDNFIKMCGDEAKTKELVEFMNEDVKRAGYDGIILLACEKADSVALNQRLKSAGFDAAVAYNLGEDAYKADYSIAAMNRSFNAGSLPLMAAIGVGFNDIGWTEVRTPNASVEEFTKLLNWAKEDYMPRLGAQYEEWMSKFVFHNTWNEYGEGHYIMPSGLNGFGYLDANRAVFSSVAGKDDSNHTDVLPTEAQKARLSYLYPARNIPIRRTHWIVDEKNDGIDYDSCDVIHGWYFDNKEDCTKWMQAQMCSAVVYDAKEKALVGQTLTNDGAIKNIVSETVKIDTEKVSYIRIKMKLDEGVSSTVQIYWQNTSDTKFEGAKGASVATTGGGYKDVIIDVSKSANWKGIVDEFRLDPLQIPGNFYIKSVEFLSPCKEKGLLLDIDKKRVVVPEGFYKEVGDELFVAGNPSDGFYSLNKLYYEWNRWDGTLMIKNAKGNVFNFVVGSDKVLIDGKESKLPMAIEVVDGLPMVPQKLLWEYSGAEYTVNNTVYTVRLHEDKALDAQESRVENQWEFNVPGDVEGWAPIGATIASSDGQLVIMATPLVNRNEAYDPIVTNAKILMDSKIYKQVAIRVKPMFEDPAKAANDKFVLYFGTSIEKSFSETKTCKIPVSDVTPDEDGYYNLVFDFSNHEKWNNSICSLRFDPTNCGGTYAVDYIKAIMDPAAEELAKARLEAEKLYNEGLKKADEGAPFIVENADAEGDKEFFKANSHNATITIVEDDLIPGNHAYKVEARTGADYWSYFYTPTRFKPGITYRVECDIRILCDSEGQPITEPQPIMCNFKYTDVNADGVVKESMDHHGTLGKFTTDMGWLRVSYTHQVKESSPARNTDNLTFFSNPFTRSDGTRVNVSYMIDNIVVTVVESEEE